MYVLRVFVDLLSTRNVTQVTLSGFEAAHFVCIDVFCSLIGVLNYRARTRTELTDNFGIGLSLLKDLIW